MQDNETYNYLQKLITNIQQTINQLPRGSINSLTTIMQFYKNNLRNLHDDTSKYLVYIISSYAKNLLSTKKVFTEKFLYSRISFSDFYRLNISPFNFENDDPFCSVDLQSRTFSFNESFHSLDSYVEKVKNNGNVKINKNNEMIHFLNNVYLSKTNSQLRLNYIKELLFSSPDNRSFFIHRFFKFIFHDSHLLTSKSLNQVRVNLKKHIKKLKSENQELNDKIIVFDKFITPTKSYLLDFQNDLTNLFLDEGFALQTDTSEHSYDMLSQYLAQIGIIKDSNGHDLHDTIILGLVANSKEQKYERFNMSNFAIIDRL